jgi:hypothetical protein
MEERREQKRSESMVFMIIALVFALSGTASGFADGPPPGQTGGFDEYDCTECHMGGPVNASGGKLAVYGIPDPFKPGRFYSLTVELNSGGVVRAGFEMSSRIQGSGAQAGTFLPVDDRVSFARKKGVQYTRQTKKGSLVAEGDTTVRWRLRWVAPATGPVVIHVSATAADGDGSALGDAIYTKEFVLNIEH